MRERLSEEEDKCFELRNGLVYRKHKNNLLFYGPCSMETNVIRSVHEDYDHRGGWKNIWSGIKDFLVSKCKRK